MITRFNLMLDARGRIRTARNNGDDRGLSLRQRRAWYADDPPATPATPPTPDKPAPEPEKSGAVDSGADDKKVFDEAYVKELRSENADWRKKYRDIEKRLADFDKQQSEAQEAELKDNQKWQQLAEKREKEIADLKADYEGKLQNSLKALIGKEFGLPDELVARLQGATEEELRADAKVMAKYVVKSTPPETEKPTDDKPTVTPAPETQPARGQQTTTAVPGGQPVGRTDEDRRKDYIGGSYSSPMFQGGKLIIRGSKGDLDATD